MLANCFPMTQWSKLAICMLCNAHEINHISFKYFIVEKTICKNKLSLFISILKTFMRITKFGCVWYPIVWLISRKYLVEHSRPSMENRKLFFSFISTKVFINWHISKQTWTHVLDFKMPTFFHSKCPYPNLILLL